MKNGFSEFPAEYLHGSLEPVKPGPLNMNEAIAAWKLDIPSERDGRNPE